MYILRNPEGRFYVGQTSDVTKRLERHNEGKVFWTRGRGPWKLACARQFQTRSEAMAEEQRLKRLKSKKALEAYVVQQAESRLTRD